MCVWLLVNYVPNELKRKEGFAWDLHIKKKMMILREASVSGYGLDGRDGFDTQHREIDMSGSNNVTRGTSYPRVSQFLASSSFSVVFLFSYLFIPAFLYSKTPPR